MSCGFSAFWAVELRLLYSYCKCSSCSECSLSHLFPKFNVRKMHKLLVFSTFSISFRFAVAVSTDATGQETVQLIECLCEISTTWLKIISGCIFSSHKVRQFSFVVFFFFLMKLLGEVVSFHIWKWLILTSWYALLFFSPVLWQHCLTLVENIQ